ncbi:MAG TPA: PASTA domain-containing protein [Gaiellaceae bacterium]|nr:PASTA domain-containing protein [Gaiellaceae bacterium]
MTGHRSGVGFVARVIATASVAIAATAAVAWGASQGLPQAQPAPAAAPLPAPQPLVVPDVRHEAFVFAKSTLQEAGFAWRVKGRVHGFPANTVVSQSPAPGTRLVDTGAPPVTLALVRTRGYPQLGEPADRSPYAATKLRLAAAASTSKKPPVRVEAGH